MWGQVHRHYYYDILLRIIPTRVGTSLVAYVVWKIFEDHPHACGDKGNFLVEILERKGSSPRVWGQVPCTCGGNGITGIIPTRVGTRGDYSVATNTGGDHPHACGDKHFQANVSKVKPGSSPRVWGQVRKRKSRTLSMRIIPTRVGTRRLRFSSQALQ